MSSNNVAAKPSGSKPPQESVAIVGMAGVFPKAKNLHRYWENIVHKVDAVVDPPADWESELFVDQQFEADNERIYCSKGGYLGNLAEFNPVEHGIMPNSVDGAEPDHFLALRACRAALADAGYLESATTKERTEVIIGRGTYVNRGNATVVQHGLALNQFIRILKQLHPEHSDEELATIKSKLKESLPPFNAETAPGLVPNIISGRVANRLDLMGANYIVDAACASSLVAVDLGMRDLAAGRCDLAVVGGVHASTPPLIVMIFCQLNAISQGGRIRPFDSRADGTLLGEGVGMVVLKRLSEAQRDGDRIYAVLKSVGTASDGRAVGLLAPRLEGEELALRRAYEQAGIDPSTIGLMEAHGTATPVGDQVEIEALTRVFGERGGQLPSCALGSVKSMISHLMPAAGIAGLIKVALSLYHKVLPPTINCEEPNPELGLDRSVFYINSETRPWIHGRKDSPRRAGINAFGFGGINAHAVLEEYTGGVEAETPSFCHRWDSEVFVLSGDTRPALLEEVRKIERFATQVDTANLKDLAFTLNTDEFRSQRLTIVATSLGDLTEKLSRAATGLEDPARQRIRDRDGIYFFETPLAREGTLAYVFPGEGSQYTNMLSELCMHFPEARQAFDLMDRAFNEHSRQHLPSELIFPPPSTNDGQGDHRLEERLWEMDAGAEAVFTANQALCAVLTKLAIRPDAMLGHSTGEHSALLASGMVQMQGDEDLIRHVLQVNAIFEKLNSQGKFPEGVSAAVSGVDSSVLQELAARNPGKLYVAIDNCPHQVVLSGTEDSMAEAMERLRERRAICQTLPFTRAYHTPGFETFSDALRAYFGGLDIQDQVVDVYSCVIADRYPKQADEIRSLASLQWARPVRFRETIERMYQDGVRIFVEVGPRGNLIAFINDTLRGKEFTAIPADVLHRSGTLQLNHLVAELAAQGVSMSLEPLYARRSPRRLETGSILGIPGREQPASSKDVHLATGLQPLRLPADFTASKTPPAVSARTTAGQSPDQQPTPAIRPSAAGRRPGSLPSRRARSASPKPASTKKTSSRVMEQHLHTMEEFLKTQEQVMQGFLRRKKTASGTLPAGSPRSGRVEESPQTQNLPFIDSIVEHIPGRSVTATCRIDLTEDVLFKHHTLGRDVSLQDPSLLALPVVPLTITMEILAQGGSLLQPEKLLVGMRNLRAYRWITLEEPHLLLEISAQLNSRTSGGVDVSVRQLVDDRAAAPVLAEGIMLFAGGYRKAPPAERFGLQEEAPSRWTSDQLYREGMFHGPCFQAVKSVARTGRDGNTTTLQVPPRDNLFATKAPTFLTDAVILDAAGQAVAFWTQEEFEESTDIFPYRLESLELFGPLLEPGTEFECRVRARTMGENQLSSDIDIVDKAGSVYYRLVGWEDRRFDIPKEFLGLRISPPESNLSAPWELPLVGEDSISELTCCYVDQLSEEFLEAHTGIWGKVLKHLILGKKEREYLAALKGPPKRLREWLLGRAAAKDAVRLLLDRQFGLRLCPADIEVIPDSAGRPRVGGGWTSQVGRPVVSISHSGGVAVALATMNQDRLVGIDIECLSRPAEGFERIAFTQREQELLSSLEGENRQEWLLRFWCAKEALLKALGQGFSNGLQAVGVRSAEFDKGVVTLSIGDGLMEEFGALRGKEVPTYTIRQEDFITSVVFHPQGAES